jgi:hypothetical protein
MYSPYDSKNNFVMFSTKYNLPTYYGSRVSNSLELCGKLANQKRKIIIKRHSYITNGSGTKPTLNNKNQISVNKNKTIKINNVIYVIPSRFCKYINSITELVKTMPLTNVLKFLSVIHNIEDLSLYNVQPSFFKRQYKYPAFNTLYTPRDNIGDFHAPFKLGPTITLLDSRIDILKDLYAIRGGIRYVYVTNNDGRTYTDNIIDMIASEYGGTGSASFWGTKLSKNFINFDLPVVIFPIDDVRNIQYGKFKVTSDRKLVYIPYTTIENFSTYIKYNENMTFNIKTGLSYNDYIINYGDGTCKYNEKTNLYINPI